MTLREADILEYYLRELPEVRDVTVYERTCDAVITFKHRSEIGRAQVEQAMADFRYDSERALDLVPEQTGRELNRKYEDQLFYKIVGRIFRKAFLPAPLGALWTVAESVPFIYHGLKTLFSKGLKVEVLDAAAITASMAQSDFDTAGSVMFLLKIGGILEEWTRNKSIGDLARSMSLNVDKAWVRLYDQDEISDSAHMHHDVLMDVRDIEVGQTFIVRNSNVIPLDGVVTEGEMTVNQSTMTGESEPVFKEAGDYVYAGTVVEEGECLVRVTRRSGAGKYDQIVRMIEETEKLKSETETKAYRLADNLVPYSFLGAGLTWLITRNIMKALSFLMVDFSCAMKLSMPLTVMTAIRESRDNSINVKGGKFMEAVASADTVVFDKTGTLTFASPTLVEVVPFGGNDPDEMLRVAACLEEHYPHSVANAIVDGAAAKGLTHDELHTEVRYIVAHGVASEVNGEKTVIGSYHFVMEDEQAVIPAGEEAKLDAIKDEYSRIFLAIGGKLEAVLCIFDPVKPEAAGVIDELHRLGVSRVCMMTGDNRKTATAVAAQLGLDDYRAEVLPEDKAKFIRDEHLAGRRVIMIGDSVNDTPALSEADVGISVSNGAAIAREISDITVTSDDLMEVVKLRQIAAAMMDRIHQNYRFILAFNSSLIGLGVLGVLSPATSALLHNGSTVITGLNSMTNLLEEA